MPEFCHRAFVGKQRAAVHRQFVCVAAEPFVAADPPDRGKNRSARLIDIITQQLD
jgi:hypothetical protein